MKTAEEILSKVKEYFTALTAPIPQDPAPAPAPAPEPMEAMTETTLADGTPAKISNLQPGGTITIIGADSAEIPAPAGEHKLSDGTVLIVAEGGIISDVKPAEQPAAPAAPSMDEMLAGKVKELEEKMAALTSQFNEYREANNKFGAEMVTLCTELSKQPTDEPDPEVKKAQRPVFVPKTEGTLAEKFSAISKHLTSKK